MAEFKMAAKMAIGQHNLFNFWPRKVYDGSISTNIGTRNSFFMLFCHFDVKISIKMQNHPKCFRNYRGNLRLVRLFIKLARCSITEHK